MGWRWWRCVKVQSIFILFFLLFRSDWLVASAEWHLNNVWITSQLLHILGAVSQVKKVARFFQCFVWDTICISKLPSIKQRLVASLTQFNSLWNVERFPWHQVFESNEFRALERCLNAPDLNDEFLRCYLKTTWMLDAPAEMSLRCQLTVTMDQLTFEKCLTTDQVISK